MGHALQRLGIHGAPALDHREEALPDGGGAALRAAPKCQRPGQVIADRPLPDPAGQHPADLRTPKTPGAEQCHAVHRTALSRQHRSEGIGAALRHDDISLQPPVQGSQWAWLHGLHPGQAHELRQRTARQQPDADYQHRL
ncbi:hypothetical protein D3C85_1084080 [compost metagenome]